MTQVIRCGLHAVQCRVHVSMCGCGVHVTICGVNSLRVCGGVNSVCLSVWV